ncbi:MAG: hypothetical protein EBY22_14775, partial [Gammaproteobacteria bacterium]|nr:hypothetical protein [Gammaproteobacteria bacterium]
MPAEPLFAASEVRQFTITDSGVTFAVTLWLNPQGLSELEQEQISKEYGDRQRIYKDETGKPILKTCLGLSESEVLQHVKDGDYTAVGIVKNTSMTEGTYDEGSGSLQYYDWCESSTPQLWVNDLCRITNAKHERSPVHILLKVFEALAREKHIMFLYLSVDNEATVDHNPAKLIAHYNEIPYNFTEEQICPSANSTIMYKEVPS